VDLPIPVDRRADAPFVPTRVLSVEVTSALPDPLVLGAPFGRAAVVVRAHSEPLGMVGIDAPGGLVTGTALGSAIDAALGDRIRAHLAADGLAVDWRDAAEHEASPRCLVARAVVLRDSPSVSVVIPTIDRPEALRRCLQAVLEQPLPAFEIVIVDNAPTASGARDVVASLDPGDHVLRYETEPVRGASRARNRGLRRATGEIVVFLDGDARPDAQWLPALVTAMATPIDGGRVPTCATGAILPDDLRTEPQAWLEEWGGFAKGFERRVFDRSTHTTNSPLYPFAAGTFGSGANMAFRTHELRRLGGFDIALGPGTPARGGEDLAAFVEVITSGGAIVYAPDAIVWHAHHEGEERFRSTIRAYGTGLAAYITRHAARHPLDAVRMAFAMPAAASYFFRSGSPRNIRRSARFPPGLWKDEVAGLVAGPFAFALGSIRAVRSGRSRGRR
jgi:GT2 family glycosyltransferase